MNLLVSYLILSIIICEFISCLHEANNTISDYHKMFLLTNESINNLCMNYEDFCLDFHRKFVHISSNHTLIDNSILVNNCTCYRNTFLLNSKVDLSIPIDNDSGYYDRLYLFHHNEYNQFLKYLEIETFISKDEQNQLYLKMNECNKKHLDYCGEELLHNLNKYYPLLWNETSNFTSKAIHYVSRFKTDLTQSYYKSNVDCIYEIIDNHKDYKVKDLYDIIHLNKTSAYPYHTQMIIPIEFTILQSKCLNNQINYQMFKHHRDTKKNNQTFLNKDNSTSSRRLEVSIDDSINTYNRSSLLYGGSSFEISLESNSYIIACQVLDRFTNEYLIHCLLPFDEIDMNSDGEVCGQLTVILDYEHFSAFADIRASPVRLRYHITHDDMLLTLCRNVQKALSIYKKEQTKNNNNYNKNENQYQISLSRSDISNNKSSAKLLFISQVNKYSKGFYKKNNPTTKASTKTAAMNYRPEYHWIGGNSLFPSKKQLGKCMKQYGPMIFTGSSHMRFNFDHTVYSYVNKDILYTLDKVHDKRVEFGGFVQYDARYISEMASYLTSDEILQSCSLKKPMNVIAMTGTWDLFFWTPRNFIKNPSNGLVLLQSLHRLISLGCDEYIRITWVTTVPQIHRFVHWSNNFALIASMQWLLNQLVQLNYKNLEIVDAFRMILPTMTGTRDDNVCKSHYLCHKGYQDNMLQTIAGKLVLSTILRAACNISDEELQTSTSTLINWKGQLIRDLSVLPTGTLVRKINTDNNTISNITTTPIQNVYMIWYGMRRLIPNLETIACMKLNITDVLIVSELELLNVAIDMPFPSLKDKSLVVTISWKYYIMDKCLRRLIPDNDFSSLTIEFNEEIVVSGKYIPFMDQYDLKLIPSGKDIKRLFGNELATKLNNQIIRLHTTDNVYYLIQNNTKSRIIMDMNTNIHHHHHHHNKNKNNSFNNISMIYSINMKQFKSIPTQIDLIEST